MGSNTRLPRKCPCIRLCRYRAVSLCACHRVIRSQQFPVVLLCCPGGQGRVGESHEFILSPGQTDNFIVLWLAGFPCRGVPVISQCYFALGVPVALRPDRQKETAEGAKVRGVTAMCLLLAVAIKFDADPLAPRICLKAESSQSLQADQDNLQEILAQLGQSQVSKRQPRKVKTSQWTAHALPSFGQDRDSLGSADLAPAVQTASRRLPGVVAWHTCAPSVQLHKWALNDLHYSQQATWLHVVSCLAAIQWLLPTMICLGRYLLGAGGRQTLLEAGVLIPTRLAGLPVRSSNSRSVSEFAQNRDKEQSCPLTTAMCRRHYLGMSRSRRL